MVVMQVPPCEAVSTASLIISSLSKSRGPDAQDVNLTPQWADPCGSQALLSSQTDCFSLLAGYAATLTPRKAHPPGGDSKSDAQSMRAFRNRVLSSGAGGTPRATVTDSIVWGISQTPLANSRGGFHTRYWSFVRQSVYGSCGEHYNLKQFYFLYIYMYFKQTKIMFSCGFLKSPYCYLFFIHRFLYYQTSPSLFFPSPPSKNLVSAIPIYRGTCTWGLSHCCLTGLKTHSVGGDSCLVL